MIMNTNNNNNGKSYLYLDNSAFTGEDTREIVGYVGNIAVPQYPVKASELDKLFSDVEYVDILDDLDSTVREATDKQYKAFAEALGVTDTNELVDLLFDRANADKHIAEAYKRCCHLYNKSFYDAVSPYRLDDICIMFGQWAAQKLAGNKELAELIDDGFLSPWGGQFYLINGKVLLYSLPDDDDEYCHTEAEARPSSALFDVTSCIWRQIQAYYGISAGRSFAEWTAGRSYRSIMNAIAAAVWGLKDSSGMPPVRLIKSL